MMKCNRCGQDTPRLTLGQTRCPQCQAEVAALIRTDVARRARRTFTAKDLTEATR